MVVEIPIKYNKLKVKSISDIEIPEYMSITVQAIDLLWNIKSEDLSEVINKLHVWVEQNEITKQLLGRALKYIHSKINQFDKLNAIANSFSIKIRDRYYKYKTETFILNDDPTELAEKYDFSNLSGKDNRELQDHMSDILTHGAINCFKFLLINNFKLNKALCENATEGGNLEIIRTLVNNSIDFPPICFNIALSRNYNEIADFLMENYNATFEFIDNLLQHFNYRALIFNLENKVPVYYLFNEEKNSVFHAIDQSNYPILKLLKKYNVNFKNLQHAGRLFHFDNICFAVMNNNIKIVKFLYKNGLDVLYKIQNDPHRHVNEDALSLACYTGNEEIFNFLLDHYQYNINYEYQSRQSIIKYYIEKDTDDDYSESDSDSESNSYYYDDYSESDSDSDDDYDESKFTLLTRAISYGNVKLASILLERGAETNIIVPDNGKWKTPLIKVFDCKDNDIRLKMIQLLLDHNADPNLLGSEESPLQTALNTAITPDAAEMLLNNGALPEACIQSRGLPHPLFLAIAHGYTNIVKMIVDKGASVNMASTYGLSNTTPLLFSLKMSSKPDLVKFLLDHGANPDAKVYVGVEITTPRKYVEENLHDLAYETRQLFGF